MDYDIRGIREELIDEAKPLIDEIRPQVSQAVESSGTSSIRVDLKKDDVAQTEPGSAVRNYLDRLKAGESKVRGN